MVKLNLLPPKERTRKKVIKENAWALFLSFIVITAIALFTGSLLIIGADFNSEKSNIEKKIEKQVKENSQYKETEDAVETLNENIALITKLENQNIKWSVILDELRDKIPVSTTLSEINVSQENTNNKTVATNGSPIITLKGSSIDIFPTAKFRESLDTSEYFEYVDFESATTDEDSNIYEFIIKIEVSYTNG